MDRARRLIDSSAIFEIKLDNPIGTFDFEEALREGLGNAYGYVRGEAEKFFRGFADKQRGNAATRYDPWSEVHPAVQRMLFDVGRVYEAQHQNSTFSYLRISVEITAHCLAQEGGLNLAKPDVIRLWYQFKATTDPIYCIKFQIHEPVDSERPFLGLTRWQLKDAEGNEMPTPMALPMLDPTVDAAAIPRVVARDVVLFFQNPLPAHSGPYELFCVDEAFEIMGPLARVKTDECTFWPLRPEGPIECVNLVLHAPNQCPLTLWAHEEGGTPGRQMDARQLLNWNDRAPADYNTYGWTGTSVIPPLFGFRVSRP